MSSLIKTKKIFYKMFEFFQPKKVLRQENPLMLVTEESNVNECFEELKFFIKDQILSYEKQNGVNFFFESGTLSGRRKYFYLKSRAGKGVLFEISSSSVIISSSHKIYEKDLFLRDSEVWDQILFMKSQTFPEIVWIVSHYFGKETVSFSYYKHFLKEKLLSELFIDGA